MKKQMTACAITALLGIAVGRWAEPAWAGESDTAQAPSSADQAALNRELLSVEEDVDALKERVFRSKATLQLLKEVVMEGSGTSGRATVWHVNKLGQGFKLESLQYSVDGQVRFMKGNTDGALDDARELKIQDGVITPGAHTLNVDLKARPTGYGVFSYVKNYVVELQSSYGFTVEPGRACTVKAVVAEKSGVTNSLEDRVAVEYEFKCERIDDAAAQ